MVRSLALIIALMFCLPLSSISQVMEEKQSFIEQLFLDPNIVEHMHPKHGPQILEGAFARRDIDSAQDVLTYELWSDWTMALMTARPDRPERKAESRVRLKVHLRDDRSVLKLHAETLIIDSILVDGQKTTFTFSRPDLGVDLSAGGRMGDTVDVDIYYAVGYDQRGFYAYSQSEVDTSDELLSPIAFTFSQPEDARYWFPCYDVPHDKAVFTAHVRVPGGYVVVSNGTRTDSTADTDTTSWQTWYQPIPMPTYLFAIHASEYHRYDQEFVSITGDTIPIFNYHWLADHDGDEYNALLSLEPIPEMFSVYEEVFGPYPFHTYGHATIAGVRFGGMEHQTMSSISRRWLKGDAEVGYAHEVAHQWIGDKVTCASWSDIWLNEGGASFSEALWYEHKYGELGYIVHMLSRRARYMRSPFNEPAIYDPPLIIIFNEATTYCKSAWIYHMIRTMVGDEVFFSTLRTYLDRYHLRAAQTIDFQNTLAEFIPSPVVDWDTFFDQWLVGKGHPRFVVLAQTQDVLTNGTYRSDVTIRQTQSGDGVPEVFHVPLTIRFMGTTELFDTTIVISERVSTVRLSLPFIPDSIRIDPNYNILTEGTGVTITSVNEHANAPLVKILSPIPLSTSTQLELAVEPGTILKVVSIDGRTLYQGHESSPFVLIDTSTWASGLVSIVASYAGTKTVSTIAVVR